MLETISFPIFAESMAEYGDAAELQSACRALGCAGIEAVWGPDGPIERLPHGFAPGYHLTFFPDWLDFWNGDEAALLEKFGSRDEWIGFYGGADGRETLLRLFRDDLARAVYLGARYVVFHVSDVSLEEGYTYRWLHTPEAVIDASAELLNILFSEKEYPFTLLLENLWWPGFTFTDPAQTQYLLERVRVENKGLLLDTGHLLNTDPDLKTQADGIRYLHRMLDEHGALAGRICGMHLHYSLSGEYVKAHTGAVPPDLTGDYLTRFGASYGHILRIDRHQPWTDPDIAGVIRRIGPRWLTHELSCGNRAERERAVAVQRDTLQRGGLTPCL
jgi:hypothetical protein